MSFSTNNKNWTLANLRWSTFVTLNFLTLHPDLGCWGTWLFSYKAPSSVLNALLRKLKEWPVSFNHLLLGRVSHSHFSCWIPFLGRDLGYGAENRWMSKQLGTRLDTTPCQRSAPTTASCFPDKSVHLKSINSRLFFHSSKNFWSRPSVSGNEEQFKDRRKVRG